MGDEVDGLMTAIIGIGIKGTCTTNMVGVTVRVDRSIHFVLRPSAQTGDHTLGSHAVRDVKQCESVVGVEDDDVAK